MMTPALLSVALLLLLLPGVPSAAPTLYPIRVQVKNSINNSPLRNYNTSVVYRGILLGGLTRLQKSNKGFRFTYTQDPNYGPFLQSVNGLAGSQKKKTYWELLVKPANNQTFSPDVGIGCYIPNPNDLIILNYTKY